jgi:hypothetical protein
VAKREGGCLMPWFVMGLLAAGALVLLPVVLAPALGAREDTERDALRARVPYDFERDPGFGAAPATVRDSAAVCSSASNSSASSHGGGPGVARRTEAGSRRG